MAALELLLDALVVVLTTLAAAITLLIGHAFLRRFQQRVERRQLREARSLIAGAITKRGKIWGGRFQRLPWDVQRLVFLEAGRALAGTDRHELRSLAHEAGLIDRAERECRRRSWSRRLAGARFLTAVGGGEGIMPALLDDPHPMVRAEAIQWARHHPDALPVERLLDRLDTHDSYERSVLVGTLIEIGVPVVGPLARYLADAHGIGRATGLEVAAGLGDGRLIAPALRATKDTDPRVRAQSATVLGRVGGSDAAGPLLDMLDDRNPDVRREAARALGRLGHWKAAHQIATLLDDNDRMTRQAAALALHALGGPGRLVCRELVETGTPRVAALANSILALPRTGTEAAV